MIKYGRKKWLAVCLTVVLSFLAVFLFAGAASPQEYSYRTILEDVSFYKTPSFAGEVIVALPKNAELELIGFTVSAEGAEWQKVKYLGEEGYVLYADFYATKKQSDYHTERVRVKSKKMGEKISLYKLHDIASGVEIELSDGTALLLVKTDIDYGEFSMVQYDGRIFFVLDGYLTSGISYNQSLALIISAVTVAVLVGVFVLVRLRRKRRV